jgi:hypothetical protein
MPRLRDHEPLVLESFNGLWARGDADSVPSDHFIQADNIQYIHSGFKTRDPLDKYQNQEIAIGDILRSYTYVMQTGESLIVLTVGGSIYHVIGTSIIYGPILTIVGMTDFGFVAIAGRAYITPFTSTANSLGVNSEAGLEDNFIYVYKGDGTNARKAAGFPPTNTSKKPFIAFNSSMDGVVSKGIHIIAVAYDNGELGTEVFPIVNAPGDLQIQLANIPIDTSVVPATTRSIVMTQAIDPKDYTAGGTYTYYEVVIISDNTTESIKINIGDADLVTEYVVGITPAPSPSTSALLVANTDTEGFCDFGFHLIGVVYETDTGYLSAPGPEYFGGQTFVDTKRAVNVSNIPIPTDPAVVKKHLVSTKWIPNFNGDQKGFQFFFIPEATLDDVSDTEMEVSYYDSDLLSDASHLIDNFSEIPAFVGLTTYHGRMVGYGEFDNISVARISTSGEPEAISQVDGLIIAPLDGNPITNAQEFRDILYIFKKTRTLGYSDNGDVPSSWQVNIVDQGVGAPVHGIATVLDSGGVNIDYLIIADYSGIMVFSGVYTRPELSWKIEDFWFSLAKNDFRYLQLVNDSINKKIWVTLPPPIQHKMLYADYGNGLDPKNVRYAVWIFDAKISSITLMDINKLIICSVEAA